MGNGTFLQDGVLPPTKVDDPAQSARLAALDAKFKFSAEEWNQLLGAVGDLHTDARSRECNVRHYGAKGDGTTDDAAAFGAAFGAGSDVVVPTGGAYRIGANLTVPAGKRLRVEPGAVLDVAAGVTLTVNGPFQAGLHQAFSGNGSVVFGPGTLERALPQWWGAKCDGVADDRPALAAMVTALAGAACTVLVLGPTYVGSALAIPSSIRVRFEGPGSFTGPGAVSFTGWDAAILSAATAAASGDKDWYADSANGNDANTGRRGSPMRTIAALLGRPIQSGDTLYLARGSSWREQLAPPANCSVLAYGSGARPVLDCADVVPNASFTPSGTANVWQATWAHQLDVANKVKHSVWENGTRLVRATSLANCSATPGSFYAAAPNTVTKTDALYVHPTGSTDPSTNGRTYEAARRKFGCTAYRVEGLHTRRNGSNDGSVVGTYLRDCLAEDGSIHNLWNSGVAEDCIAWKNDGWATAGTATMFVTYTDASSPGAVYRRCKAIASTSSGTVGFYFHTAGGGAAHSRMVYEDCEAVGLSVGFAGTNFTRAIYKGCRTYRCSEAITTGQSGSSVYILGGILNGWSRTTPLMTRAVVPTAGTILTMRGVRVIARQASGAMVWASGTVNIRRCTFAFVDTSGFPRTVVRTDTGSLVFRNNVVGGTVSHASALFELGAGVTLDSDENVLHPSTMDAIIAGTTYADIAAYQAATGKDAASVVGDPLFRGGLRDGDTSLQEASPAWTVGATVVGAGADVEGGADFTLLDTFFSASAG